MWRSALVSIMGSVGLAACDSIFGGACPADVRMAVEISLTDSVTSEELDAAAAVITLRYQGTAVPLNFVALNEQGHVVAVGGGGKAGFYDVAVEMAGYLRWTRTAIRVTSTHCGPETQHLRVRLQPAAP